MGRLRLALASASLIVAACASSPPPADGEDESSEASTSTTSTSTTDASTGSSSTSPATDSTTTVGTTTDPSTSTTTDTTGSDTGTDTGSTGAGTTGCGDPDYPDCVNFACAGNQQCLEDNQGGVQGTVCGDECRDRADCASPNCGNAVPACVDIPDGNANIMDFHCVLDCTEDTAGCPPGMECGEIQVVMGAGVEPIRICIWPS